MTTSGHVISPLMTFSQFPSGLVALDGEEAPFLLTAPKDCSAQPAAVETNWAVDRR